MSEVKNKVEWCLRKAEKELEKGGKHRGLIKVNTDVGKAREHVKNLNKLLLSLSFKS